MTYYIGIAGTHSTGKTTFLSELKQLGEESGIKVEYISDTATKCQNMGFPILSDHTFESTLWIITSVIKSELEAGLNADLVLVDRPVPDAIGYLNAALKAQNRSISVEQKEYLYGIVEQHSRRYNLLLKTELDESIPLGKGVIPILTFDAALLRK